MAARWPCAIAVALALLVAGCAGLPGQGTAVDSPDRTSVHSGSPEGTVLSPAGDGLVPDDGGVEATVIDVVDGDTLDVRYPNGTTDTVRLLGIDTPEVHVETDPAEFEGVPDTEAGRRCLRSAGENASAALTQQLDGARVRLFVDPLADRRDRYDRLLAYVVHEGRNVNYRLVASGHARVYDSRFRYAEALYAAERAARSAGRGLWRCRSL